MKVEAHNNGVADQRLWPNLRQERPPRQHPLVPVRYNQEAVKSTMPPQIKLPIIQSVMTKLTDEAVHLELEDRLKVLEAAVRRS